MSHISTAKAAASSITQSLVVQQGCTALRKMYHYPAHEPNVNRLILEIGVLAFFVYVRRCRIDHDGINPISRKLVYNQFCAERWKHFSPRDARTSTALESIGLHIDMLTDITGAEQLDISCLPTGWDDTLSAVYRILMRHLHATREPYFLSDLRSKRVLLYQEPHSRPVTA